MGGGIVDLTPLLNWFQYRPKDESLFVLALTHRSFFNESSDICTGYNERLEFIGDAVLDLAMSHILMSRFPQDSEGSLSKKRASLVNEDSLFRKAVEANLGAFLRVGKGEAKCGGLDNPRLLASAYEALLGAYYFDAGFDATRIFIEKCFFAQIESLTQEVDYAQDYKTRLQELLQKLKQVVPTYKVLEQMGPEHDRSFRVVVVSGESVLAEAMGKSKKSAEQEAARLALETFRPEALSANDLSQNNGKILEGEK